MNHHSLDLLDLDHRHTRYILCPAANMSCRGTNLDEKRATCDVGDARRTVFAFTVRNAFRNWNGLVGWEICDIIGGWRLGLWIGLEDLRRRHERVPEMRFSFDQDGADASIVSCLPEN